MDKDTEKFLKDVGEGHKIDDSQPIIPEGEEKVDEGIKNRRHKRLEERLTRERQSAIELADSFKKVNDDLEYLKRERGGSLKYADRFEKIIGNDTDQKKALVAEMSKLFEENEVNSEKRAIERLKEYQVEQSKKEAQEQEELTNFVEDEINRVEDSYGIDLTSGSKEANERYDRYVSLVKKMSPKDKDGEIREYADFDAVAEIFKEQESKGSSLSRKKEASSRSGTQSSPSNVTNSELSGQEQWLKQNGILPRDFKRYTK